MHYYLVAIGSNKYHGQGLLTYSFDSVLTPGSIIEAPLRNERFLGFVVKAVSKPTFAVKPINQVYSSIHPLPEHLLRLFSWMVNYYPAPLGITAQLFLPKKMLSKPKQQVQPNEQNNFTEKTLPTITKAQKIAVSSMKPSGTHLLHGETGSGKTRVYIELAKNMRQAGRSSIILTPEISLTTQLANRFMETFGPDNVTVLHSEMTEANRRDAWLNISAKTEPQIIIGARSALFCPLSNTGLIVLDESHESSYKQENAPHYHAARVASKLAEFCDAQVVLGSATPSIIDYFLAEARKKPILRLAKPATGTAKEAKVESTLIDMRDRKNMSRNPYISNALLDAIELQLRNGQQTLLFLNRRGTARIVLCGSCGWQALCKHCDLPLTFHHDTHQLRCHVCGFHQPAITNCPKCSNSDITLKNIGTKTVFSAIERMFPSARVQRFDADNLTGDKAHENYTEMHSGSIDILVGTQLLAKGFDLPRLGLIGVLNADSGLYIPDFTSQERTYQQLYQVLGRVGRGHQAGKAIIQTYSPDNPTILAAINKDWSSFYASEIMERKKYLFPPFCYLLKAFCTRSSSKSAMQSAEKTRDLLLVNGVKCAIEGPAPSFHEKTNGKYSWQLVLKSSQRPELLKAINLLPKDWHFDIDPIDLL